MTTNNTAVAQPPCFHRRCRICHHPFETTEVGLDICHLCIKVNHFISDNTAVAAAMSSTYTNAVASARTQFNHFIGGPTPNGMEAVVSALKAVLQEEFKRLKSTSTL